MNDQAATHDLNRILKSAKSRFTSTGQSEDLAHDLESVVAACWGVMTSQQRGQLMSCPEVAELLNPIQASTPTPVALPHYHHVVTYSSHDDEENMFQSLMVHWYQVADILRQLPAGTVASYPGGSLFVGALNGELYLFDSPDLDEASTSFNMFRPDDFNGIGEDDLEAIRDNLVLWLKDPTYDAPVSPEAIMGAVIYNYSDSTNVAHWVWDGIERA